MAKSFWILGFLAIVKQGIAAEAMHPDLNAGLQQLEGRTNWPLWRRRPAATTKGQASIWPIATERPIKGAGKAAAMPVKCRHRCKADTLPFE